MYVCVKYKRVIGYVYMSQGETLTVTKYYSLSRYICVFIQPIELFEFLIDFVQRH